MLNLNSKPSPDPILTFSLRYRDVDQRTLAGAKFLNLDDCIRIFQPANSLAEKEIDHVCRLQSALVHIRLRMESRKN